MRRKRNLRCLLGWHYRQKVSARFFLMGMFGHVETWVCTRCDYKHEHGRFIPE